jgi:glutaredoxin 3
MTTIKVYSTKTCPWCDKLKGYLTQKGIKFQSIDVTADPKAQQEMIEKSGQMGVPVTEIGETIIVGFDKDAVDQAIAENK